MKKIKEKRMKLRFPNDQPVKLVVDGRVAYVGTIQDISQKGAFVITNGPFFVGQKVALDFRNTELKYEKRICKITRIVPNGVAIQFDSPLHARNDLSSPLP